MCVPSYLMEWSLISSWNTLVPLCKYARMYCVLWKKCLWSHSKGVGWRERPGPRSDGHYDVWNLPSVHIVMKRRCPVVCTQTPPSHINLPLSLERDTPSLLEVVWIVCETCTWMRDRTSPISPSSSGNRAQRNTLMVFMMDWGIQGASWIKGGGGDGAWGWKDKEKDKKKNNNKKSEQT